MHLNPCRCAAALRPGRPHSVRATIVWNVGGRGYPRPREEYNLVGLLEHLLQLVKLAVVQVIKLRQIVQVAFTYGRCGHAAGGLAWAEALD